MTYLYMCGCGESYIETPIYRGANTIFDYASCLPCGAKKKFYQPAFKAIASRKLTWKERFTGRVD